MKEITEDNFKEIYEPLKDTFLKWAQVNESIVKFQNYASLNTFQTIFEEDSERLWRHFKVDCDSKFDKFKTYLTQGQINILMLNIFIDKYYIY